MPLYDPSAFVKLTTAAPVASSISHGASRWDPWYGNKPTYNSYQTAGVFTCRTPVDYTPRAPLHANLNTNPITWGDSQDTFDNEITVAYSGGLDYFAYLFYNDTDGKYMNGGLNYHLASGISSWVKLCLAPPASRMGSPGNYILNSKIVQIMQQPCYFWSPVGPLLYVYIEANQIVPQWGSNANFVACLADIKARAKAVGLNPTIITLGPGSDLTSLATFSVDAVGWYGSGIAGTNVAYSTLDAAVQSHWVNSMTASAIVPWTTCGWDPSARNQHPESFATPEANTVVPPTLTQFTNHLIAARSYIKNNPARCPHRTILSYSWSEYDECGIAIAPTIGNPAGLASAFKAAKLAVP